MAPLQDCMQTMLISLNPQNLGVAVTLRQQR